MGFRRDRCTIGGQRVQPNLWVVGNSAEWTNVDPRLILVGREDHNPPTARIRASKLALFIAWHRSWGIVFHLSKISEGCDGLFVVAVGSIDRRSKFYKRSQLFICSHNESISIDASDAQDRARIISDCRTANDAAMISSTICTRQFYESTSEYSWNYTYDSRRTFNLVFPRRAKLRQER
jgi:hypothetical protein